MSRFWVNCEDVLFHVLGGQPLTTASSLRTISRLDRTGEIAFSYAAADPSAFLLDGIKPVARGWRQTANGPVECGAGTIDRKTTRAAADGTILREASGNDILDELSNYPVDTLKLWDGAGNATFDPFPVLFAFAPGWSLDTVNGYSTLLPFASGGTGIYLELAGESVLETLNKIAEATGEHFILGTGRTVIWKRKDKPASGVYIARATESAAAAANLDLALIDGDLEIVDDTHDLVTRVKMWGSGNADARPGAQGHTRTLPPGYTYDPATNWLLNTTLEATLGRWIGRHENAKDITPIGSAAADATATANAIMDQAIRYLQQHAAPQRSYRFRLSKLDRALQPGQTIEMDYLRVVDGVKLIDIDTRRDGTALHILEVSADHSADGVRTVALQIAEQDVWPATRSSQLGGLYRQLQSQIAHTQPTAALVLPGATAGQIPIANALGQFEAGDISTAGGVTTGANTFTGAQTISASSGNVLVVDTTTLVADATNHRVGIGTASPLATLDLHLATNANIRVRSNIGADLFAANDTNAAYTVLSVQGSTLVINYNSGGNVGIGVLSPGARTHIQASGASNIGLIVQAAASPTANLTEWQNSSGSILSRINNGGYVMTRKTSAPADADLVTDELAIWLDNAAGATRAMFKAKDSAGVVRTGSVALT